MGREEEAVRCQRVTVEALGDESLALIEKVRDLVRRERAFARHETLFVAAEVIPARLSHDLGLSHDRCHAVGEQLRKLNAEMARRDAKEPA